MSARTARDVIAKSFSWHRLDRDASLREADAILAALAEAGLVVVPRVPTEKMCLEVKRAFVNCTTIGEMWAGMIEAANEQ